MIDERKKGRKQRGREISVEGGKKEIRESLQKKQCEGEFIEETVRRIILARASNRK